MSNRIWGINKHITHGKRGESNYLKLYEIIRIKQDNENAKFP